MVPQASLLGSRAQGAFHICAEVSAGLIWKVSKGKLEVSVHFCVKSFSTSASCVCFTMEICIGLTLDYVSRYCANAVALAPKGSA